MTEHEKLMTAVMSPDVKTAATTFVEELVSSTMLAVQQDPRAYGFVSLKDHDARVAELLEANNREVERRREAEAKADRWGFDLTAAIMSLPFGCGVEQLRCSECQHTVGSVLGCTSQTCPIRETINAAA